MRRLGHGLAALMAAFVVGCGDSTPPPACDVGAAGCACTPGGACNTGLTCFEGRCAVVLAPGADAASFMAPDSGPTGGGLDAGVADAASADSAAPGPEPVSCASAMPPAPASDGGLYREPLLGDWPDCKAGCANRHEKIPFRVELDETEGSQVIRVRGQAYQGLLGRLDDASHGFFPDYDSDLVSVRVRPGTLVEITVEPYGAGACIDPLVTTLDPGLTSESRPDGRMTMNNDRAAGDVAARTLVAAPVDDADEWFVAIDDARNLAGSARAGGQGFHYLVRFKNLGAMDPRVLQVDEATGLAEVDGTLENAGDLHHFRFVSPLREPHSVIVTSGNPAFCPQVFQLDPTAGRRRWLSHGASAQPDSGATCTAPVRFDTNTLYADEQAGYWIAVGDRTGGGSNSGKGPFTYKLQVTRRN